MCCLVARYQGPVGKDGDTGPFTIVRAEERAVLPKELQPFVAPVINDENATWVAHNGPGKTELVGASTLTVSDRFEECTVLLDELQSVIFIVTHNDYTTWQDDDPAWHVKIIGATTMAVANRSVKSRLRVHGWYLVIGSLID